LAVIRNILRVLGPLINRPRVAIGWIAFCGFLSGLADGILVVLVVRMALEAANVDVNPVRIPFLGSSLGEGATIVVTIALVVFAAALHLLTSANAARLATEVLAAARRRAYKAHVDARWEHQQGERQGSLQETISMANTVSESSLAMAELITATLMVVTILGIALTVSAVSVGVVVVFAVLLTLLLRPLGRRVRSESRRSAETSVLLAEKLGEVTLVSRELRAFGVFGSVTADLDELNTEAAAARRRALFLSLYVWLLHSDIVVMFLVVAVSVIYGSRTVEFVGISTVALLVARALTAANQLQQSRNRLDELGPIVELFDDRISALDAEVKIFGDRELQSIGVLNLTDVSYEYKPGERALDSVTLDLFMGESLGIIGPSGAGKTTLVKIIARLREATLGSVSADGCDVDEFSEASWTRIVAIVPQEPHLIEGTVRDNIRFYRDWIDDESLIAAARDANLLHEIERLPQGFATQLGPQGSGVSVGQKQRLAIARALAGKPKFLILDEPTSALDPRSERSLRVTMENLRGSVALVMVTHRMSTVDVCDRLIVVDRGRIVASGSVDQIMGDESLHDLTRATIIDTAEPSSDDFSVVEMIGD